MLGHVCGRDAVAQLHLAPGATNLRALQRRDQRPGLVAQAADLGAHRLEHLPRLPVRRPPVLLQPRDLVAHTLEALRDRIQAPLDLLRALPKFARRGRAIGLPLRRREFLELFGDLTQGVRGDRLHLFGELFAIARDERDLLLHRGSQIRELPLMGGVTLRGKPGSMLGFARGLEAHRLLGLPGDASRFRCGAQSRDVQNRERRSAGEESEKKRCSHVAFPCSLLSLRGEATSQRTYRVDRRTPKNHESRTPHQDRGNASTAFASKQRPLP